MYQSDPSGDTNEAPNIPCFFKTTQNHTENLCWAGTGKQQPLDYNLCKLNKDKR